MPWNRQDDRGSTVSYGEGAQHQAAPTEQVGGVAAHLGMGEEPAGLERRSARCPFGAPRLTDAAGTSGIGYGTRKEDPVRRDWANTADQISPSDDAVEEGNRGTRNHICGLPPALFSLTSTDNSGDGNRQGSHLLEPRQVRKLRRAGKHHHLSARMTFEVSLPPRQALPRLFASKMQNCSATSLGKTKSDPRRDLWRERLGQRRPTVRSETIVRERPQGTTP